MNKFKKVMSVTLAGCMAVSTLMISASAVENNVQSSQINTPYSITTNIEPDGTIVHVLDRSHSNTTYTATTTHDYSQTKRDLLNLGMEEELVDRMSDEDLEVYAESPYMWTATNYFKTTADGETVPVSEEEALTAVHEAEITPYAASDQDKIQDSYMRVHYMATDMHDGNGKYRFKTSARWLTMPYFRGADFVGACSQRCTFTPNSDVADISYTQTNYSVTGAVTGSKTVVTPLTKGFQSASKDTYNGRAVKFQLPKDIVNPQTGNINTAYTNVLVHHQFDGKVDEPDSRINFNSAGAYMHQTVSVSINPTLTIAYKGTKGTLGVSAAAYYERGRDVFLEINYVP